MKKITLKIPLIHILSILLFYLLIKVSMETEIQGKNEFAELLYGMTFFMRHDIITLVFGVVLIIPFLLLILSLFKKRRDFIIGASFASLTSILLIIMIFYF
ncbi:MAG: hypothetical protein P8I71_04795 [Flavobacteriaceae bacterium]|nr:hypothetical protein [Flavobacteriaceae bacterium]